MQVTIIGVGNVGSQIAFALLFNQNIKCLQLISKCKKRLKANILDLQDAARFINKDMKIIEGYKDVEKSDLLITSIGDQTKLAQFNRLDEYVENVIVIDEILKKISNYKNDIINITNPEEDIARYIKSKTSNRVHLLGVELDKARLEITCGKEIEITGTHQDQSFKYNKPVSQEQEQEFKERWKKIYAGKGYTNFGIAGAVYEFVENMTNHIQE